MLFLIASWSFIVVSYLVGMSIGCDEPTIQELAVNDLTGRYFFFFGDNAIVNSFMEDY